MARGNRSISIILLLMVPEIARAQGTEQRYELGGLITYTFLREIGTRDVGVGTESAGLGGRLVYRAFPLLDLETEISFLPGNSATSGNHLQGFFGVKAGKRWKKAGIFLKARPGFIHFRRDPFGVGKPRGDEPSVARDDRRQAVPGRPLLPAFDGRNQTAKTC